MDAKNYCFFWQIKQCSPIIIIIIIIFRSSSSSNSSSSIIFRESTKKRFRSLSRLNCILVQIVRIVGPTSSSTDKQVVLHPVSESNESQIIIGK